MISFSPVTSNMHLISKCLYPSSTSQTTNSHPTVYLVYVLRWLTGILGLMNLHLSSWLLISLPKSAAHPSPCMHMLKHHLSQDVDISLNDSVFHIIPHSHCKQGQQWFQYISEMPILLTILWYHPSMSHHHFSPGFHDHDFMVSASTLVSL